MRNRQVQEIIVADYEGTSRGAGLPCQLTPAERVLPKDITPQRFVTVCVCVCVCVCVAVHVYDL